MIHRCAARLIRGIVYGLLTLAAVAFMMASLGCATAPKAAGPRPDVAIPCPEPTPLFIPLGTNSNQLDALLAMAYWDLLAQYHACQQQQGHAK
jgi:hypothetical protein